MKILGISNNLGAGAVYIENNIIKFAIHEERFTRNKDFRGYPKKSINHIFQKFIINYKDLDFVVYGVTRDSKPYKDVYETIKRRITDHNNLNSKKILYHRYSTEKNGIINK